MAKQLVLVDLEIKSPCSRWIYKADGSLMGLLIWEIGWKCRIETNNLPPVSVDGVLSGRIPAYVYKESR